MLANEEYREKQKKQLIRLHDYQLKKEAQRLEKQREEEQKAREAQEEANRQEAEWLKQLALKQEEERKEREWREKEAKDAFSTILPKSLIEILSTDELSDIDEPKSLKPTKIKEEKIDPEFEKKENGSSIPSIPNGNGNGGDIPYGGDKTDPLKETNKETTNLKTPTEKKEPTSPKVTNVDRNENPENGNSNAPVKENYGDEVVLKPVCMDPNTDQIQSNLTELGDLIVDQNVLYALRNLKHMGETMRRVAENDAEASRQGNLVRRSLFSDFQLHAVNPLDILTPHGGYASIKMEPPSNFSSPPHTGKVFGGLKCLNSDSFVESYGSSTKKKKKHG